MSMVLRLLLYALCLFLVMVVYTGQKHETAAATLRSSARMTVKLLIWTVVGFAVMVALQVFFID